MPLACKATNRRTEKHFQQASVVCILSRADAFASAHSIFSLCPQHAHSVCVIHSRDTGVHLASYTSCSFPLRRERKREREIMTVEECIRCAHWWQLNTAQSTGLEQWACVLRALPCHRQTCASFLIISWVIFERSWGIHKVGNAHRDWYQLLTYCKIYLLTKKWI